MNAPAKPGSRRRVRLVVLGCVTLVIALALLVPSTYRFLAGGFPDVTSPVAEFDEGEAIRVIPETEGIVYVIALVVDDVRNEVPPLSMTIVSDDGSSVPTGRTNGWAKILGRNFRHIINVIPDGNAPFTVTMDVADPELEDGRADFALFRHPNWVLERYTMAAMPWWVAGSLVLVVSIVSFLMAFASRVAEAGRVELE